MNDNLIELKPVGDLLGMKFFIPNYQRGYRWKEQQVKDLLNDIDEFIQAKNGQNDGFYCVQPLVVKENIADAEKENFVLEVQGIQNSDDVLAKAKEAINKYTKWEVIDGQQRLTTIYILLSYLGKEEPYKLEYETRSNSATFLSEIAKKTEADCTNIDFFHMYHAYNAINTWFDANSNVDKSNFKETLLKQVKFIWYKSTDEDPIKVFTRLNIGKISLTNAELIKALFLNRSNFSEKEYASIRLKQQEIASEWDKIEYTLQNEEFWLFLNKPDDKTTRIDMIFDLVREQDRLEMYRKENKEEIDEDKLKEACGTDKYKTFRYFYNYSKSKAASIKDCWSKVKEVFQVFEEWYNDLELYHYVGYLVDQGEKKPEDQAKNIPDLLTLWKTAESKQDFIGKLKEKIKGKLSNCNDLSKEYETSGNPKTQCRPLLLLHNIQTVINQNNSFIESEKFNLPVFYKFPFHLYKKEASSKERYGWEIEHISPNSGDKDDAQNIKIYLKSVENSVELSENVKNEIDKYVKNLNDTENIKIEVFDKLKQKIKTELNEDDWTEETKNMLWNFTLLDSKTNQEYQNYVFSFKRVCVLSKERGKKTICTIDNNEVLFSEENGIAFVLPCTKNVFTKAYTSIPQHLSSWTYEDAKNYLLNINEVLKEADFIKDQTDVIDKLFNKVKNNKGDK